MQESTWSSADTITAAKSKTTTRSSNASTRYSTSSGSDAAGAIGSVADLLAAERRYLQVIDDRIAGNEHDVIICNSASRSIIRNSASCSTTPLSEEQHGHSESILLPHDTMSFVDNESDADIEVVAEHCRDAETLDNDEQLSDKALLEGLQEVEDALRAGLDEFGLDSVTGQHVVHSAVAAKRAADVEELDPIPRDVEDDAECTDAEILEKLVAHVRGEVCAVLGCLVDHER